MTVPRKSRFAPLLPALLTLSLLSAATPLPAQTAEPDPDTGEGPRKLLLYVACAAAVFASNTVPVLIMAIAGCGRLVIDETRSL